MSKIRTAGGDRSGERRADATVGDVGDGDAGGDEVLLGRPGELDDVPEGGDRERAADAGGAERAVTRGATRPGLTPLGRLQFSKSHTRTPSPPCSPPPPAACW